jgi:DNA-binding transcriptional LysR family regulator
MHPGELSAHACIQFRMPDTGKLQRWQLRRGPNESEPPFATKLTCNSNEARLCFALEGLGIAYMSEFSVRAALDTGALVTVLDEYTSKTPSGCCGPPEGKSPRSCGRSSIS